MQKPLNARITAVAVKNDIATAERRSCAAFHSNKAGFCSLSSSPWFAKPTHTRLQQARARKEGTIMTANPRLVAVGSDPTVGSICSNHPYNNMIQPPIQVHLEKGYRKSASTPASPWSTVHRDGNSPTKPGVWERWQQPATMTFRCTLYIIRNFHQTRK